MTPRALRYAVFAPYLAVAYPLLALRRAHAHLGFGGAWRTWITPELLVGGFMVPGDARELARLHVGAVVNVSRELIDPTTALREQGIAYRRVPCWDGMAPELEDADDGVAFIASSIRAGRPVYVHCASGVGRSVSLALCYLATHEGADVEKTLEAIRRVRPRVALRAPQRAFVDDYVRWHARRNR